MPGGSILTGTGVAREQVIAGQIRLAAKIDRVAEPHRTGRHRPVTSFNQFNHVAGFCGARRSMRQEDIKTLIVRNLYDQSAIFAPEPAQFSEGQMTIAERGRCGADPAGGPRTPPSDLGIP